MKDIVIIGSSCAGHTLALALKEQSPALSVTMVSEEEQAFYDRRKLPEYFAGRIKEKSLFTSVEGYAKAGIRFLGGRKALGLAVRRKQLALLNDETRESIGYDVLAVCSGTRTDAPEIPGVNKEGVLRPDRFDDFKAVRHYFFGDTVCFVGWERQAEDLARLTVSLKKELKIIVQSDRQVPVIEGAEVIRSSVAEIIGETGVQAVKLAEGKVIGTSLVVLFTGSRPNTDFLKDTGIELCRGYIAVDADGRTSLDGVYACGSVVASEIPADWDGIQARANALAATVSKLAEEPHVTRTH